MIIIFTSLDLGSYKNFMKIHFLVTTLLILEFLYKSSI